MEAFDLFKTIVIRMTEGEFVVGDYKFFFVKKAGVFEDFGISFTKKETTLCLIKPYGLNKHFFMHTDYNDTQIIEAIFDILIEEDFSSMIRIEKDAEHNLDRMYNKYC